MSKPDASNAASGRARLCSTHAVQFRRAATEMGESENVKRGRRQEEVVTRLLFRSKLLTFELSRRQTQSGSTGNSGAFDVRLERKVRGAARAVQVV